MIPRELLGPNGDAAAEFHALDEATLDCLRDRWPGLHFALCSDDDVPARLSPVLARPGFNLYLVDGSDHCLSLTNDPEVAVGVVLAWMDEEEALRVKRCLFPYCEPDHAVPLRSIAPLSFLLLALVQKPS